MNTSNKKRQKKINKLRQLRTKIINPTSYLQEDTNNDIKKDNLTDIFRKQGLTTKKSKKIYVFMGSYTLEESPIGFRLSVLENPPWEYFNKYRDLETEEIIDISKENVLNFENNNIILKTNFPISIASPELYLNNFQRLQQLYYQTLSHINQEQSIKYIKIRAKLPVLKKNQYRKANNDAYRLLLNYKK